MRPPSAKSKPNEENEHSLLFLDPVHRLQCRVGDELDWFVKQMREYLDKGYYLAGWIGYEFGYLLEDSFKELRKRVSGNR